jgi:hypothetical protein
MSLNWLLYDTAVWEFGPQKKGTEEEGRDVRIMDLGLASGISLSSEIWEVDSKE